MLVSPFHCMPGSPSPYANSRPIQSLGPPGLHNLQSCRASSQKHFLPCHGPLLQLFSNLPPATTLRASGGLGPWFSSNLAPVPTIAPINIYKTLQAGMKQNLDAQFRSSEQGYQQPRSVSSSQKSTTQPTTGDDMTKVVSWVRVSPSGMGQTWAVIKVGQNRNKIIQTDLL